jgi:hypothetical protein
MKLGLRAAALLCAMFASGCGLSPQPLPPELTSTGSSGSASSSGAQGGEPGEPVSADAALTIETGASTSPSGSLSPGSGGEASVNMAFSEAGVYVSAMDAGSDSTVDANLDAAAVRAPDALEDASDAADVPVE